MNAIGIVLDCLRAFDDMGIAYMLVGSFSSNMYGRPRSTQDADFVLQWSEPSISQLRERLGAGYSIDPQMSLEGVTGTTRFIVTVRASAFTVELFLLSDDAHDQARFARRQKWPFAGREVWLPAVEDVVVTKLRWSRQGRREKDVDDVRNLLAVQAGQLDLDYLRRWCDVHGTRDLLERLLRESA